MRGRILAVIGLLTITSLAHANSYQQTIAIQNAQLYGDSVELSEPTRHHYVSQGQEYLRNMVRSQVAEMVSSTWLHDTWIAIDPAQSRAGVQASINSPHYANYNPIVTKFRIYADEDLNRYMECGRFLPIEIEMESFYQFTSQMRFKAKVEAPFDDFIRFHIGSDISWTSYLNSHINYSLSNHQDMYDGLTMGIGFTLASWRFNFNYDLTSDYVQLHHLAIAKSF